MKEIYNGQALVSVKTVEKQKDYDFYYQNYKKGNFWRSDVKEGYRNFWEDDIYTKQEVIDKGRLVESKIVYHKPYVRLSFENGETYTQSFNTYEAALEWGEEQAKGIKVKLQYSK